MALATLNERRDDFDANYFINELFEASKLLGVLEAKITSCQFNRILIPMFRNKEAISSMSIEGTETTITDVLENNIRTTKDTEDKVILEYRNHRNAILYGTDYLRSSDFNDELMYELHNKSKVINFPFFYISEAISQDKGVYYKRLTDSRSNSYDEWIRFFLQKCIVQAKKLSGYIDELNKLYEKTKVKSSINSPKFDQIIECIFTQPVLNVTYLAEKLSVTSGQAKRYLNKLEEMQILLGDDRKRGRRYYFVELLDLARLQ